MRRSSAALLAVLIASVGCGKTPAPPGEVAGEPAPRPAPKPAERPAPPVTEAKADSSAAPLPAKKEAPDQPKIDGYHRWVPIDQTAVHTLIRRYEWSAFFPLREMSSGTSPNQAR